MLQKSQKHDPDIAHILVFCIENKRKPTMALLHFSSKEFLFLGLELAGFSNYTIQCNEKKMNLERFKDSFYASPQTAENIFTDIQDEDLGESRIVKPNPILRACSGSAKGTAWTAQHSALSSASNVSSPVQGHGFIFHEKFPCEGTLIHNS